MNKNITLTSIKHEDLLKSGQDRVNARNMWPIMYPKLRVQTWLDGLPNPPSIRGYIDKCELDFHSQEDAALFKMFWL